MEIRATLNLLKPLTSALISPGRYSVTRGLSTSRIRMSSEDVLVKVENGVREIRLNRTAKKNAFTAEMYENVGKAVREAETDDSTNIMVFTANGDYFSSGNDLKIFEQVADDEKARGVFGDIFKKFIEAFIDSQKPIVALVNGHAVGIGVTILPHVDVVYSVDSARFTTPFSFIGISPEAASTYTIPRILGYNQAMELLVFNEPMTAVQAQSYGLVTKVFPQAEFEQETSKRIQAWAKLSPGAVKNAKELIKGPMRQDLHRTLEAEQVRQNVRFSTPEFKEAVLNMTKRKKK